MTITDVEKRVKIFLDFLNKAQKRKIEGKIISKKWKNYEKDRTYITIKLEVDDKTLYFKAGFINNDTRRYHRDGDYVSLDKEYVVAFDFVLKRLKKELDIDITPPPAQKKEKTPAHPMMRLKLDEMRHAAERIVLQREYLDRTPAEVREQKEALIKYAEELLSKNAKKAEFCKLYDMRADVSRAENAARNRKDDKNE